MTNHPPPPPRWRLPARRLAAANGERGRPTATGAGEPAKRFGKSASPFRVRAQNQKCGGGWMIGEEKNDAAGVRLRPGRTRKHPGAGRERDGAPCSVSVHEQNAHPTARRAPPSLSSLVAASWLNLSG